MLERQALPDLQSIQARVLRQIRRDVTGALLPELQSTYARFTATTISMMLDQMILWLETGGDPLADDARKQLLDRLGQTDAPLSPALVADFDDKARLGVQLEVAMRQADEAAVEELAGIEFGMFERETKAIQRALADDEATAASMEVEVTKERLDRYFAGSDRFQGLSATSITRIPGGYSKDTFIVAVTGDTAMPEFVIRRDFPFGPTDTSAADEFPLLKRLFDAGLPVAQPYAAVRERSWLGEPFIVMERKPGINPITAISTDKALALSICLELAGILGRLHGFDPERAGFSNNGAITPTEQLRHHLRGWREHWERNRLHPVPLVEAAFGWLDRHIPQDIAKLVIVHGDARPDNMLIEDGKATALLDWEFCHLGDPAEELEYTRLFVQEHIEWPVFMATYLAAGGAEASAAGSRFYEVWRSMRNFICCDVSWSGFVTGRYPVIKLSAQGVIYRRYFLKNIADSLKAE